VITLAKIVLREGDTIDSALQRFKNQVRNSGKLDALKKKEYYMSPSAKRRLKSKEAKARNKKKFY
jgi:small subunit ribosomal protein S21